MGGPIDEIGAGQPEREDSEAERRRKAVADWKAWREMANKSISPEAAALTDEDIVRIMHEMREEIEIEEREKANSNL